MITGIVIATAFNMLPKSSAVSEEASKAAPVTDEHDLCNAFVHAAEEVGPAVVSITTETVQNVGGVRRYYFGPFQRHRGNEQLDDFFDDFFRDFFRHIPEQQRRRMGFGSGVIIDKEGYILTNEHVVGDADGITVTLADGREFAAKLMGKDTRRDLAVIKIEAENVPVARLGNSDSVRIGEWVVAIGNPFGHVVNSPQPTVTAGVVSALHRSLPLGMQGERVYVDLIQTDAAINPGNSGGPLCDLDGNIIGINVAIASTTGGYQGIGFAIPINTTKAILSDLIKGSTITYAWIGVSAQDISQDIADYFELPNRQGALVASVIAGGPAAEAGVMPGDIITSFKGEPVRDLRDLLRSIGACKVGERAAMGLLRNAKATSVTVTVGERPGEKTYAVEKVDIEGKTWRGVSVGPITDDVAAHYSIEDRSGVIVENVAPNSSAYRAGLREGDVIRQINRMPVGDVVTFHRFADGLTGNVLVLTDKGYLVIKTEQQ